MNYYTKLGESLRIVGNNQAFGFWDTTNALKLKWTKVIQTNLIIFIF